MVAIAGWTDNGMAGQKLYDMAVFLQSDRGPQEFHTTSMHPPVYEQSQAIPTRTEQPFPVQNADASSGNRGATKSVIGRILSEVVLGVWFHDPGQDNNESNTWDLNAEIIFNKITYFQPENKYLRFLVTPRPFLGGSLNNEDETHTVYTGLNWTYQFESNFFIAGTFGFTYHTGNLEQEERQCAPSESCSLPGNRAYVDTGEVTLGSRILFRESIELGYRFYKRHGVSIYAAHISNGSIFDEDNDGMNFVGLRYSYAFD